MLRVMRPLQPAPRTLRRHLVLLSLFSTLALLGCRRSAEPQAKQATPVRVRVVAESTSQSAVRFSGSIEPGTRVELAFKVGGYVRDVALVKGQAGEQHKLQEGDWVKKDTVLAIVQESDYRQRIISANAAFAEAVASEKQAKLDFERASKLVAANSVSQAEADSARVGLEAANARVQGARSRVSEAQLSLADCTLRAPMDGVILKRSVEIGSLVAPGSFAFSIADTRSVKVVFGAPDSMLDKLKIGGSVAIKIEALQADLTGTISRVSPSADPKSRVFDVQATIPNPNDQLKVGMIASLKIPEGAVVGASLSLPLTAVVRSPKDPRGFAVFVVDGEAGKDVAHLRDVKLGDVLGNAVLVTDGLKNGERIIFTGATLVADNEPVRVVP